MLASEPPQGENVWHPLEFGELLAVDASLRLHRVLPRHSQLCMAF
jgi:hypothetical protein